MNKVIRGRWICKVWGSGKAGLSGGIGVGCHPWCCVWTGGVALELRSGLHTEPLPGRRDAVWGNIDGISHVWEGVLAA
jgi:hypothetical protein